MHSNVFALLNILAMSVNFPTASAISERLAQMAPTALIKRGHSTVNVLLDTARSSAKITSTNALQILAKTTVYALEAWTPTRVYVRQGTPV